MHTAHPVQPQHVAARLATLVSALVPTPLPLVLTSPDPAQPCGPVKTQAGKVCITPKEGVQQAQVVESKEFKTVQVPPASNDEQLRAALQAVQVRCGYTLLLPCNSGIGLSICWLRLPGMRDPGSRCRLVGFSIATMTYLPSTFGVQYCFMVLHPLHRHCIPLHWLPGCCLP